MPIRFRCKCGKAVKVGEQYAGQRAKCPNCGAQLVVPSVSTAPEAGGPNAKAGPSAQSPETLAAELQLESERIGPGGKTGDTAQEVTEIEESAPEPESVEVVEAPADSAPAAAPSEPGSERVCPNCGAAASPQSVICMECGANIVPEKAPEKKPSGIANAFQSLREHKAFPLIAAVAAVVVILIVTVVIIQLLKSKKPIPVPVAQVPLNPPPAPPPAKVPEKPKPPPEPQYRWPGFSDPALIARDRILKIGQALAAYVDKNHQPPAALAEAGVTEADSAGCNYVGAEIAALPRFRAMVYESKPTASYEPYVLFSDGSARPVSDAQSVLLKKTEFGWATDTDAALLAKTAPMIRVSNVRFASLEVALDDKPAAAVPRGGVCTIPAATGPHQITFTAGGQKEGFQADLKPGIVYTFVHPWQADLAWIPMRQYHATLTGHSTDFTVDKKDGIVVKSLKSLPAYPQGPESVDFLSGDGRNALAPDLRSIAARITREKENLTIEGPAPNEPIRVNEIGRLEAGVVRFKGDLIVTYRQTALGALRCEELPNTGPAAVALIEAQPGKTPASKPKTTREGRYNLPPTTSSTMHRPPRLPEMPESAEPTTSTQGETVTVAETPPPPQVTFPAATFTLLPDCEALAAALSSSAPDAIQLLLQRAQLQPTPAETAPDAAQTPLRHAPVELNPADSARPEFQMPQHRAQLEPKPAEAAPARETPLTGVEQSLRAQEIPAPLVYGALAFYGQTSTFEVLKAQYEQSNEKMAPESPAYPPLLLALARSGGTSALAYLQIASAKAPTSAVISLCTIALDDAAARKALAGILANWAADDVAEAVDEWPVIAGPACRIVFVETVASANPALLDDVTALNALMKLEPFALEHVLVARLETEPNEPTTPQPQPSPAAQRWQTSTPTAPAASRSSAPLSWIALAHLKNSAAVTHFVQLLGDNDLAKRLRAAAALGEVRDPSVVPLLTLLLKDKEAAMRRTAAAALAQMPDAAVVGALDAAMDKDLLVSAIVEQAPALAAKAGTEATAALLAKMLTLAAGEKAPAVKPSVAEPPTPRMARGGSTTPARAPAAELAAARPVMIIEALNRLGLYSPPAKTALEAAREAPDPAVRAAAYKACEQAIAGASAAERSASAIAAAGLALKDKQAVVRVAGIGLLSAAEPKAAVSLLLPATKDPDAEVRAAAVSALPAIADDPSIAAAITGALSDSNPKVISAAALALASLAEATGNLQPLDATGSLALLLANKDRDVRIAAVRALGKLKDAAALSSIQSELADKDPAVVAAAIGALSELDAPDAVKAALDALGKETLPPDLRRRILMRLADRCADPKSAYGAWAATGPALKDADLDILVSIAPSATAAMKPGLIALATRYLADPQAEARKRAASILANYTDDPAVRTMLLKALEQNAAGVAQAAADVLRRVRDDSMIDVPLLAYYRALCESSGGAMGPGGAMGHGQQITPSGPSRGGIPAVPAPASATMAPLFPGLTKATAEESALLRAAIIEALGSIGGDRAGKALRTIEDLERKRNSDDMAPHLIAAFESSKVSGSVRDLCEYYVVQPERHRLEDTLAAIKALTHMASLDPARVKETLKRLADNGFTPPAVAAAAVDALDEIQSTGGT